jgi:hypothetical protein
MKHTISLLLLVFLLTPVWGQNFEVLKAEYGAGTTWTDVTEKVKSLVRGNGVEFVVDGSTLGDPLPGVEKTLRIRYAARGRVRTENFADHATVRLGNPGGGTGIFGGGMAPAVTGLQIERARYGDGRRWLDVTQLLRDSVRDNSVQLQVSNATFGQDPAPATPKLVEVDYVWNGQRQTASVKEGQMLRLGAVSGGDGVFGGSGGGFTIDSARFGTLGTNVDVTEQIRRRVMGGRVQMLINSGMMGQDPSGQRINELLVEYTVNGQKQTKVVKEGGTLNIP